MYKFVRGFGWAYKQRGLYPGGLISGIKKRFEMKHGSVKRNTFLSKKRIIKQHLAVFSTVIWQRGAYIREGL